MPTLQTPTEAKKETSLEIEQTVCKTHVAYNAGKVEIRVVCRVTFTPDRMISTCRIIMHTCLIRELLPTYVDLETRINPFVLLSAFFLEKINCQLLCFEIKNVCWLLQLSVTRDILNPRSFYVWLLIRLIECDKKNFVNGSYSLMTEPITTVTVNCQMELKHV